ncbi:ArnT family glycosyltransferase [Spirosoma sp. KUDC1026]|uniref:ArnT family glycosyltransferase n=1 Tax=Spirosoma sp. KUDC1026 TaxID=2745947 RepID=UPI00159BE66F|nr:glycosyltransferase family 39 protein [Spirosoma sp. KUDC1026]QKZ12846.1 glycosyltransferase family 39 protein [Spirosoma sp. KUDC1026]
MIVPDQRSSSLPFSDRWFYGLVAVGIFLNATGLYSAILEPDGALYATIAKRMAQTGDFVNLYALDNDWLDKPHFPFWMTAISYLSFGITSFAYKLPGLLFFFMGVAYTYAFARLAYSKLVAQVAALVILTAFHTILSNGDVRAEPYLTGLIIGAVYHFYRIYLGARFYHLVLGAFWTACALMTKGPFVLVPIGAGLVIYWLLTGQWHELLKPRWYVAVLVSFVFTLPEIYCLYQQFDLHPEKVVFDETNVSGVKFFFWDSQFGRFFNTGPIKGQGDKLFFLHTLLWAFIPWSLPLYVGVGKALAGLFKRQNPRPIQAGPEYVSLGSGLATFLLFSLSGFQLPHYINIVFPFYAVLTAQFLVSLSPVALKRWTIGQSIIGVLLIGVIIWVVLLVKPPQQTGAISWSLLLLVMTFLLFRQNNLLGLAGRMVGVMLVLASVMNFVLYPLFMQYQAGMAAAQHVNENPALARQQTWLYEPGTGVGGGSYWSYEFYANGSAPYVRSDSALRALVSTGPKRIFADGPFIDALSKNDFIVQPLAVFPYFPVSRLSYPFLNYATRNQTLQPYVLVEVSEAEQERRTRTED